MLLCSDLDTFEATNFRTTEEEEGVLSAHTGSSLTMFCEDDSVAYRCIRPGVCDLEVVHSGRGEHDIPSLTANHSRKYNCEGVIINVDSDQEAVIFSNSLTPWKLIVYGKQTPEFV